LIDSPAGWQVVDWVSVSGTEMWVVYKHRYKNIYDTVLVQLPFTTGQCCKFKDRAVSKIYCGVVTPYLPPMAPDTPTFCNDLATIQQSWVLAYNRQRLEDSVRRYIVPQIEAVCQSVTDSLWWKIKQPEFAFTLYYYDRAGNRVAVVPPDGVEMLSDDSTGMVPGARASGNVLRPTHRKVVLWRYTASNQVWMRHHPDRGTDLTWYDPADRPIVTQDARQRAENKVSFIKYDSLSRPIEGGVASLYSNFTNFAYENNVPINTSIVWDRFVQVYDTSATGSPNPSGHFRGRVTTHKVWQKWTGTEEPDYVVYYDYDLMGRVKREIHEIPMLKKFKHDKFEMSYLYDAISGKVKEMIYNKGKKDEFRHRFAYDAMGNLKYVWTSRDGKKWTLESALKYYPDGKLMRREIRPKDLMLQGLDYAYTLDGWLKAINSEVLENDPSQDGISGTYEYFARDVFSLLLRYYPNDYKPIKPTATPLEATITSGTSHLYKPYYTGWISSWSLHLDTLHTAYSFRYDRLGRLTKATTLAGFNGSEWSASLVKNYSTKYSYDLVGNILSLTRYGSDTNAIDVLTYEYYNRSRNNRLKRIVDGAGRMIGIDLETQPIDNYGYDPVGNMVRDSSRNMRVFYTYSNKPKRIKIGNRTIKMYYNPSGYRFFKGKGPNRGQIFVYNSQGQLMAKYTINGRKLKLDFVPIYEGTKRLGILEPEGVEWYAKRKCYIVLPGGQRVEVPCGGEFEVGDAPMLRVMPRGEGRVLKPSRKYELTDHLNNVRVVIRDQRVPVSTNGSTVAYYKPLIESIHDYYPFGWEKQLTTVNPYPFNYQGQLFDRDLGWQYYRYRNYDPMIARFHQVEPLIDKYPWLSYVFAENWVTNSVELEGLEKVKQINIVRENGKTKAILVLEPITIVWSSKEGNAKNSSSGTEQGNGHEEESGSTSKGGFFRRIWNKIKRFLWDLDRKVQGNHKEKVSGGMVLTSKKGGNMNNTVGENPDSQWLNMDTFNIVSLWLIRSPTDNLLVNTLKLSRYIIKDAADLGLKLPYEDEDTSVHIPKHLIFYCTSCGSRHMCIEDTAINYVGKAPAEDTIEGHTQKDIYDHFKKKLVK